jgi:hypothetical protein
MNDKITLGQIVGTDFSDSFENFDLTQVQSVLSSLSFDGVIDIAHSEQIQQRTLYAADLITTYLAKLVKIVSFLESKVNSTKNKVALAYKSPDGKTTGEMKKQAGESSTEVEGISVALAKAKGAKALLEKKYDILLKLHYMSKELSGNQKQSIISEKKNIGWGE